MSSWCKFKLGDVADIRHGYPFKGEYFSDRGPGPILLTPGNFAIGGGFQRTKAKYYRGPIPEGYSLSAGDLVVTMTDLSKFGDTLGYSAIIPEGDRYLHNQRTGLIYLLRRDKISKTFLYYVMRTPRYRNHVLASATGSTVRHTSPSRILSYEFEAPEFAEQECIGSVLSAMEDKIAVNSRLASSCHVLAQSISMQAHKYGKLRTLSDLAHITMGSSPPGETYNEHGVGIPFYQGTRDFGERFPGRRVWCTSPVRIAPRLSTIVSVRAPVGELNVAREPCCIGRGVASLESRHGTPSVLFHELAGSPDVWRPFESEGTVFGSIGRSQMERLGILSLDQTAAQELELIIGPLDKRVEAAFVENQVLSELRDALLPRLMAGQISVRGVEKIVEGAT